eukprot:CAMPEP_0118633530 /NCGR_PEP_ID=MMETSP0785-20121206/1047_1 /TAXON_ID=91992 /ORGANISM="Bolidomonas pacifica, Strain CCMP 1866" /LENGTH=515 /DNA_ID=CAMNT_0006524413 /DNA_START=256 /DNA_END=1800 /DNA_ORIENTATION=-
MPSTGRPLAGVIISCTGLDPEKKDELHDIVESLGGRYTGNLRVGVNTHLIADKAQGAKYYEAYRSGEEQILIVKPGWLRECERLGKRVDTKGFELIDGKSGGSKSKSPSTAANRNELSSPRPSAVTPAPQTTKDDDVPIARCASLTQKTSNQAIPIKSPKPELQPLTPEDCDDQGLVENFHMNSLPTIPLSPLFLNCNFFIPNLPPQSPLALLLGDIMRRGMGTRFWNLNELITHVVVPSKRGEENESFSHLFIAHPNGPEVISPQWLMDCLVQNTLLDERDYKPMYYSIKEPAFEEPAPRIDLVNETVVKTKTTPSSSSYKYKKRTSSGSTFLEDHNVRKLNKDYVIAITGFVNPERTDLENIIMSSGALYTKHLDKKNTHLICNVKSGPKYERAKEWKVNIVTKDWIMSPEAAEGSRKAKKKKTSLSSSSNAESTSNAITDAKVTNVNTDPDNSNPTIPFTSKGAEDSTGDGGFLKKLAGMTGMVPKNSFTMKRKKGNILKDTDTNVKGHEGI